MLLIHMLAAGAAMQPRLVQGSTDPEPRGTEAARTAPADAHRTRADPQLASSDGIPMQIARIKITPKHAASKAVPYSGALKCIS